jgi:pimeloyl-ACP methyl ester carboxylesterase
MAEDTVRLMEYLKIKRAHILGVSMGGMIAQEIAIRYPDRVLKMILGCSHAGNDNQLSGGTADMVAAWDLPVRICTSRLLGVACNKPLNRFFLVPLYQFKVSRLDEAEAIGLLGQREAVRNHNTMDRLSLIKAPTLVISGTLDKVVKPSSSDLLAQKIPGARQVQVEGGSHTFSWEMSKRFNQEVLNFLNSRI